MGEHPVHITIRTRQVLDGEELHLEQCTTGTLAATKAGWALCYQDPSEGGNTCLDVKEGRALLERRGGDAAVRMCFQPGTACPAQYQTPAGVLELSVETQYLGYSLAESGGRVLLRYRLSSQGQSMGQFALQLRVRPAEKIGTER